MLSDNGKKIEKFCQDIRYQLELLDSHMVVYKDGKKPLITDKQYAESIMGILKKVEEIESDMPEDFEREKTINEKMDEINEKIENIKLMLNETKADMEKEIEVLDERQSIEKPEKAGGFRSESDTEELHTRNH